MVPFEFQNLGAAAMTLPCLFSPLAPQLLALIAAKQKLMKLNQIIIFLPPNWLAQ